MKLAHMARRLRIKFIELPQVVADRKDKFQSQFRRPFPTDLSNAFIKRDITNQQIRIQQRRQRRQIKMFLVRQIRKRIRLDDLSQPGTRGANFRSCCVTC